MGKKLWVWFVFAFYNSEDSDMDSHVYTNSF
jgi:hypothetical protein